MVVLSIDPKLRVGPRDLRVCYIDSLVALDVCTGPDRRVSVRVGSAGSAEEVIALM
jgi:hypothetical protein